MYVEKLLTQTFADLLHTVFTIGPALEVREQFLALLRQEGAPESTVTLYADVFLLQAAELTVVDRLAEGDLTTGRIDITADRTYTAAEKLLCPVLMCAERLAHAPSPFDVVPFFGDMQKAFPDPYFPIGQWTEPALVADAVHRLAGIYSTQAAAGLGRYRALLRSGILQLQGGLWTVKASLLFGRRPPGEWTTPVITDRLAAYVNALDDPKLAP